MNLQRIQYFLTFCETMHFTNAARRLNISQPALTKSILLLEEELGTRLIRREGKHTHLTQDGIQAQKHYADLMQLAKQIDDKIRNTLGNDNKQIRIAAQSELDFTLLAEFIASFHKAHPNINIDILDCEGEECGNLLLNGKVDCLFTHDCEAIHSRAVCIELYEESLVMYSSSQPGFEKSTQQLLAGLDNKKPNQPKSSSKQLYNKSVGEKHSIIQCSQKLWIQQMLKAGVGFGVLPKYADTINGISAVVHQDAVKKQTIFAAIPTARNEKSNVSQFVSMLKKHDWQSRYREILEFEEA